MKVHESCLRLLIPIERVEVVFDHVVFILLSTILGIERNSLVLKISRIRKLRIENGSPVSSISV